MSGLSGAPVSWSRGLHHHCRRRRKEKIIGIRLLLFANEKLPICFLLQFREPAHTHFTCPCLGLFKLCHRCRFLSFDIAVGSVFDFQQMLDIGND